VRHGERECLRQITDGLQELLLVLLRLRLVGGSGEDVFFRLEAGFLSLYPLLSSQPILRDSNVLRTEHPAFPFVASCNALDSLLLVSSARQPMGRHPMR